MPSSYQPRPYPVSDPIATLLGGETRTVARSKSPQRYLISHLIDAITILSASSWQRSHVVVSGDPAPSASALISSSKRLCSSKDSHTHILGVQTLSYQCHLIAAITILSASSWRCSHSSQRRHSLSATSAAKRLCSSKTCIHTHTLRVQTLSYQRHLIRPIPYLIKIGQGPGPVSSYLLGYLISRTVIASHDT